MDEAVLAIDQGTSSTKACVFDARGRLLGYGSVPIATSMEAEGVVLQDPEEVIESCRVAARGALEAAEMRPEELLGVALSNQGESFLVFEGERAMTPIISWQDGRGESAVERLSPEAAELVTERTGLPLGSEFPAPKLAHMLAESPDLASGRFATLDTWMISRLDPSRPFVTDRATASRSMLIGLADDSWDPQLLELFDVPARMLPEIVPSDHPGTCCQVDGWTEPIPVVASGYDMGLALLGHGCIDPGETKATFGTCLGVMTAVGSPHLVPDGLLATIAYTTEGRAAFAADGEIASAGSLVNWAIRAGLARDLEELLDLALSVDDAAGVVLIPALNGLGAPHWRGEITGRFDGLRLGTRREHLARAVVDALAWSLRDVLDSLRAGGLEVSQVRADGGLTGHGRLLQLCADYCEVEMVVAPTPETTALGAATLGFVGAGLVELGTVAGRDQGGERFEPQREPPEQGRERWLTTLAAALSGDD
jgi:glycerol kinase